MSMVAELFGTNIRATASTSAPNFVRGAVVLVNSVFRFFAAPMGVVGGAVAVGALVIAAALLSVKHLTETYGKDLNYIDT
jgi:ABC-type transport system involved in Fe-S cluster assembly fused permease/ATPase subunit